MPSAPHLRETPAAIADPFGVVASRAKLGQGRISDVERMLAVPEMDHFTGGDLTEKYQLPGRPRVWTTSRGETVKGLKPLQSAGLHAIESSNGAILPIPVGGGKALIALLAGTAVNAHAIVLAPARTLHQLHQTYAEWGYYYRMPDKINILSYDRFSRQTADGPSQLLRLAESSERIIVVADECHKLSNFTAARTKRLLRFFRDERPDAMFVGLSGTIISKNLRQMAHLVELALRRDAPVPLEDAVMDSFAECMDIGGRPAEIDWMRVEPLWTKYHKTESIAYPVATRITKTREAFGEKFRASRGVVTSSEKTVETTLIIDGFSPKVPKQIQDMMNGVVTEWMTPDGVVIPDEDNKWQALMTLSCGFYNIWDWPRDEDGNQIIDFEWKAARSAWNAHVRNELENNHREGYDSPFLVWTAVHRRIAQHGVKNAMDDAFVHWQRQSQKRWNGERQPPSVPIWVDEFYIDWIVTYLRKEKTPTIVWYNSIAMREKFRQRGMLAYGAGSIIDESKVKARHCAMSNLAQGTGLNLQHLWSNNLFAEPPHPKQWEQVIGRTHRSGQLADEVVVMIPQHTEAFRRTLKEAQKQADLVDEMLGNQYRLQIANYTENVAQ